MSEHSAENDAPPCGASCRGDCGWDPNDPDDPCVIPPLAAPSDPGSPRPADDARPGAGS